ncbi:MAG TPA: DNA polymerase IV [Anaerolineales bacterium]|nr:DNA polymerase IV [Anaerolineales bacterium]
MPRTILHLDLDAFFCAVEELHDPSLRGKAFAVGGRPDERGVVASCSYAARRFGVRSAMPMSRALRLCPELLVVSHHRGNYGEMSRKVMERLHDLSPLVEQISIDEAFVDISDLPENPETVARRLQGRVNAELGLPCSVGVASNKLMAKIATEVGKKKALSGGPSGARSADEGPGSKKMGLPPNAVTVVPPGREAAFLAPLPADMLWGVGPKTAVRLEGYGIKTIGDLARRPEADLVRWFGENGRDLARRARGVDESPVSTERETKSVSSETTFSRDVRDDKALAGTLRELSADVGRHLRHGGLAGTTVKLKLRWPDFTTLTRQVTLPQPTDQDEEIYQTALALLNKVRARGKAVRLLGVGVSSLGPPLRQLGLWDAGSEKRRKLQEVVDELQDKYGKEAIKRGKNHR